MMTSTGDERYIKRTFGHARGPLAHSRRILLILMAALVLRLAWLDSPGYVIDLVFFTRWMRLAARGGLAGALSAPSSYPPLTMYLLSALGRFACTGYLPPMASALPVEWLALRLTSVAFDLLTIAVLYAIGRRMAGRRAACGGALLYALCPGGIYLTGWWNQIDAWFVLPMLLAIWWLARRRVAWAWAALAIALGFKSQALLLLPLFVVGTWRWHDEGYARARAFLHGGIAFSLALGAIFAPVILSGQMSPLISKMRQPTQELNWISLSSHNLWYALTPRARNVIYAEHRDEGEFFFGGVSFRDAGLTLLAIGYALILSRLFLVSRPDDIFLAAALAWLTLFTLATRMHARYTFPALAPLLVVGYRCRRWWGIYGLAATTLLVNLVLKSIDISPLAGMLSVRAAPGVLNAWINVALTLFTGVLYARGDRRTSQCYTARSWEQALLVGAWIGLIGVLLAMLWQGRSVGAKLADQWAELRPSLDEALASAAASGEATVIINWPAALIAETGSALSPVPVMPPARFYARPREIAPHVIWAHYLPWADVAGLHVEYYGDYMNQAQLATHIREAETVIALSPALRRMIVLAQTEPPRASTCVARFDPGVCLVAAEARMLDHAQALTLTLSWQSDVPVAPDVTVFVHIVDASGAVVAQADGDPVRDLLPLHEQRASLLRETRVVAPLPPDEYRVWIGLYHRATGARRPAICPGACLDDALEVIPADE